LKKKIYYWGPFLDRVGTVRAIANSANSVNNYSKKMETFIINAIGEWTKISDEDENLKLINLNNNFYEKLPKYSYLKSRFSYIFIFLKCFFPLKKLLKRDQPDFLIIHLIVILPMVLFMLFKFKTKLCLRISGKVKLNFLRKFLWKISSKKIYKVFCPTYETKKQLVDEKIFDENKIIVLKDPVIKVSRLFKYKNEKDIIKKFSINNIILVGRLTKQKNFELFIKVFSKIVEKFPNLKANIFGEGELEQDLQNIIKSHKLENKIFLHGSTENVFKYMKNSKILVLSSLWEDPGAVLMEAAYCNTLIVSSDCPSGPKEFLLNGDAGFLFKNNSIESFEKTLTNALNAKENDVLKKIVKAKKNSKDYTFFMHFKFLEKYLLS